MCAVRAVRAVGVFPFRTVMTAGKMTEGYVEVLTRPGCPLFPPGRRVRGQVYHYSEIVQVRGCGGQGSRQMAAWLVAEKETLRVARARPRQSLSSISFSGVPEK